nr:hypothetical protein [Tanacetum cinerariifolium]
MNRFLKIYLLERIELISNLVKYQENYAQVLKYQTLQRKPRAKKQKKDYYMAVIKGHAGWKTKDFKGISFEQIEAKFNTFWKQIEDFIPMGLKEETQREDLNQLWRLVKETLSIRLPTSDKEKELWVELKRLYEPDDEDQLWTHTQNLMHAPVEWKLYDTSRASSLGEDCLELNAQGIPTASYGVPTARKVPTTSEESSHC